MKGAKNAPKGATPKRICSVSLTPVLYDKIKDLAMQDQRSVSSFIEHILIKYSESKQTNRLLGKHQVEQQSRLIRH